VSSLVLKREYGWFGALRTFQVRIDEKLTIPLRIGEVKTVELPEGLHTVAVKMSWCRSAPFSILLEKEDVRSVSVGALPVLEAMLGVFIPPFISFGIREVSEVPLPTGPSGLS